MRCCCSKDILAGGTFDALPNGFDHLPPGVVTSIITPGACPSTMNFSMSASARVMVSGDRPAVFDPPVVVVAESPPLLSWEPHAALARAAIMTSAKIVAVFNFIDRLLLGRSRSGPLGRSSALGPVEEELAEPDRLGRDLDGL